MTLLDLPGISNDSETKVKDKIGEIYTKYMSHNSTIIINVLSNELDFEQNEAIQISNKIDPQKIRTIYVITNTEKS